MTTEIETAQEIYQRAGMKLKLAREQANLSVAEVMSRTKLTAQVVKSLEAGEGDIFKTPVFVRGQLRSYARVLGVDIVPEIQQLVALEAPPPVLEVRETVSPSSRFFAMSGQYALYFLVTAILAVTTLSALNWFKDSTSQSRPLDGPIATAEAERMSQEMPPSMEPMVAIDDSTAPAAAATISTDPALAGMSSTVTADPNAGRVPMTASMAGSQSAGIVFNFRSESWVKFTGPDGTVVEQGLIPAGTVKQFAPGQIATARIGAAEQVSMTVNGQATDLSGFTKGSVANLTIGNDGRPVGAPLSQ